MSVKKRPPECNIAARVACISIAGQVVELSEQITLSEGSPYHGPAVVYLDGARQALARLREELVEIDTYLASAQTVADAIAARQPTPSPSKRKVRA